MNVNDEHRVDDAEPLLVTAMQLARLLQVSVRSLWRLRSAGQLPNAVRVGSSIRWKLAEIRQWIAEGCPNLQARENEGRRR